MQLIARLYVRRMREFLRERAIVDIRQSQATVNKPTAIGTTTSAARSFTQAERLFAFSLIPVKTHVEFLYWFRRGEIGMRKLVSGAMENIESVHRRVSSPRRFIFIFMADIINDFYSNWQFCDQISLIS